MLIVTDYAYRMARIERIIKMIDKPGKPKKFRFRQLKYTVAPNLAQKVQALAEQLDSVPITVGNLPSTARPSQRTPPTRLPGESTAQYQQRIRNLTRPTTPARGSTTGQPSTSAEPTVYLDADERTNRILMIGLDEQLDLVEELIDTLDVAQQDLRTLKLYRIEHVDAGDVKNKLAELGMISTTTMGTTGRTGRITGQPGTSGTSPAATGARTPTQSRSSLLRTGTEVESGSLAGEPQVVVIEATNSLLVNASAEQHAQIDIVLKYVDSTTEEGVMPYVIYPLESQKPEELASVLNQLIETTVKSQEGKIEQVVKKTDEQIEIVADDKSFSIIVYASKKNQEWIKKLIETLDKPRPQVLIDVTLVEVTKSDIFEYDLDLIESFPDLLTTSGQTGVTGDVLERLLSAHRDRFIDVQSNSTIGGKGYYADKHVQALLTLMQQKSYGRVLAKPKILVNDNEEGTISTTDTTFVQKTSSIPVSGGAAGPSENLIQTSVDYEGYEAGITLGITPHISEGDLLRLEITLNRTDFGDVSGEGPPDTTASDLGTIVTVPDGSTIILGGMIKLNQSKGGTKVPILGDLPFVGTLFRSVNNSDLQRKLYVFVKAEIIRPAKDFAKGLPDLEAISERNRKAFETFEERFQAYHNVPGVKPGPMDPVKVLDAQ
jgi:type II secretory pathway component GspD/PulD (secretin)